MPSDRKKLYVIHGSDEYRVSETAKALVDELVPPQERALGLEVFDGRQETVDDIERVVRQTVEGILTLGFFGAAKTVWLRDVTFICPDRRSRKADDDGKGGGGRLAQLARLREVLPKIPDGHTLVLSGPGIDAITGSIVKDAAKLEKAGTAEVRKLDLPSKAKLAENAAAMLSAEASKRGLSLPQDVCRAIVARAGTDPRQLMSELEKLILFCDGRAPSAQDIEAIVSPTADTEAWGLLDAFGRRDLNAALPMLHRLLDARASEIGLVIQLAYRVNDLLLARDSIDRRLASGTGGFRWSPDLTPDQEEDRKALGSRRLAPYTAFRIVQQAQSWTRLELRNARHVLDRAHARMTSVAMPSELVLELALTEAMRKSP